MYSLCIFNEADPTHSWSPVGKAKMNLPSVIMSFRNGPKSQEVAALVLAVISNVEKYEKRSLSLYGGKLQEK